MSTEHESAPARPSAQQPLLPVDGVMLALLAVAMIYGAVTGGREAMYACFVAAGGWLLIRLALHPPAPPRRRPAPPARRSLIFATTSSIGRVIGRNYC